MPIIQPTYKSPFLFLNPHLSTIFASVFRKIRGISYQRQRLELTDGDFIDLDWSYSNNGPDKTNLTKQPIQNLVIITHGLLGSSQRQYVKATVKVFNENGWDAVAWNHRGMSGEPNRLEKMTTHGSTDELKEIVNEVVRQNRYENIALVGWSKGGNISLKYAGELAHNIPSEIKAIVAVSVPTDVYGSVQVMGKSSFYAKRFKNKVYNFLESKKHLIDPIKFKEFEKYQTLEDFTEWYIAPLHGYKNAREYYIKCSSLDLLENIITPTLILNALNDPILSLTCSPFQLAKNSEIIHLETPKHGGHCSFYSIDKNGIYWSDRRVFEFVRSICG